MKLEILTEKHSKKVWGSYKDDNFKHDDLIIDKTLGEISEYDFLEGAKTVEKINEDYLETHYEIVKAIEEIHQKREMYGRVKEVVEVQGFGCLYQLAKELTDLFQAKYKDVEWGLELEWFETLEEFLKEELN